MPQLSTIITNNAILKMKQLGIGERVVMDVFNTGVSEETSFGGWNAIKKYPGQEIGVYYNRKPTGEWIIISVWSRARR